MAARDGWYFQKADECGRRAKESTDPQRRWVLEQEKRRWTEIAASLEREGTQQRRHEPTARQQSRSGSGDDDSA